MAVTFRQSITELVSQLKTLFANKTTKSNATSQATAKPNTVFYTTDTKEIIVGGESYGMSSADKSKLDGLATVATSGSYNDLSNKPTIPTGAQLGNIIRNSGFTGDYESEEVDATTNVESTTPQYSDPLKYWVVVNAVVSADASSVSGNKCTLTSGSITQSLGTLTEGNYILSLIGIGNLTITLGGVTQTLSLASQEHTDIRFAIESDVSDASLVISGTGYVADLMLVKGDVALPWMPSEKDNNKALALKEELQYLLNAISNVSGSLLNGLVLAYLIKVGVYRDHTLTQETGGMSGLVNTDNSPFLWGGGTMEQAISTIQKYADNPNYRPTDSELADMAKFVVTHGGRAILTDICLRGYIYALGGVFQGKSGDFKMEVNGDTRRISFIDNLLEYISIGDFDRTGTYIRPLMMLQMQSSVGRDWNQLSPWGITVTKQDETTPANTVQSTYGADSIIFRGEEIQLTNLPTSAPSQTGRLWNDNGTLKIS